MSRHPASLTIAELLADCEIRRLRRGGPGGQHRNKVETAVVITHRPTGITAEANERRSQAENLAQAVARLRIKLAVEIRLPSAENDSREPSALWRERCASGRIVVSTSHDDLPSLLAEALDALVAADLKIPQAARRLSVTTSQLTRFFQQEPAAWAMVNEARRTRGLRPLR